MGQAVRRVRLDVDLDPLDVLRRFRGRDRLVGLLGAWHHGDALIAFDPVRVATDPFVDPFEEAPDDGGISSGAFGGGWIGSWGHRLAERLEDVGTSQPRPVPQPDHRVAFYDRVLRRSDGTWWLETLGRTDDADVLDALDGPSPHARRFATTPFVLTPDAAGHADGVRRAVERIAAGDLFQVNLCARLAAGFDGDPLDLFCAGVAALRPDYAAFVDAPEGAVASLSPELFLRRTGREVLTSPIKGTAPLSADPRALEASAKDRAENVMIVDLMRNDLGRVCAPGSVRVTSLVRARRHAVWHLVSDVVGHLAPGAGDADLLRATFPPGSVTGAPKIRAMQVAGVLEPTAREAYTGAIGHVSATAGLELNVAIRTFEIADGRIWLGVGGGIVADSDPWSEVEECLVKARPLVAAIGGTLAGDAPPPVVAARSHRPTAPRRGPDPARGVFTTLLVADGRAHDVPAHVARLDASVRALYGTSIRAGLEAAVRRRAASLVGRHRLRVEAVPDDEGDAAVHLRSSPLDDAPSSWRLVSRVLPGGWGEHKWIDRGVLDALPDGADDLLLVDESGGLLETGRASLFLVLDDGIHTPPLDGRILPGTARARTIDDLTARGLPVHQRPLSQADLAVASEVFVTNALRGVVPVVAVDDLTFEAGPMAAGLPRSRGKHSHPGGSIPRDVSLSCGTVVNRHPRGRPRVLFVDNEDSFVYNLVQYVRELGADTEVVRSTAASADELAGGGFSHVVISPGPGAPADAGVSVELVRRLGPTTPLLGVCLGHQAIAEAYGASVVRAPSVVHGKPALVHHDGLGVHQGLPSPLVAARYHSLVVDESTLPPDLTVTSRTASGVVMGVRHAVHPVEGVQWHPESVLTRHGHDLLAAFLATRPRDS